jgi:hypothetical protein
MAEKRINYKESFELCFLRHQYIRKVTHKSTREETLKYNKIVNNISQNTFYVYKNLFFLVGLDLEDVVNISQVHLISFLGLFALERQPDKLQKFKDIFQSHNSLVCTEEDLLNKNKSSFTCFLKQRMEDLIRVCRQKAKNIKGLIAEEFVVFRGKVRPPKDIEDLLDDHEKHGYRKLGTSVFKTIKKRMSNKQEGPVYLDDGVWYVCVPIRKKVLSLTDFACNNYNPYDNMHNMNPEEVFDKKQEELQELDKHAEFYNFSVKDQKRIVNLFITENKKNVDLKEEVSLAKKYLETLDVNADL